MTDLENCFDLFNDEGCTSLDLHVSTELYLSCDKGRPYKDHLIYKEREESVRTLKHGDAVISGLHYLLYNKETNSFYHFVTPGNEFSSLSLSNKQSIGYLLVTNANHYTIKNKVSARSPFTITMGKGKTRDMRVGGFNCQNVVTAWVSIDNISTSPQSDSISNGLCVGIGATAATTALAFPPALLIGGAIIVGISVFSAIRRNKQQKKHIKS
ncbi:hypothetical protein DFA_12080 [Cavenderia fasciculata]|uniref:Uncharacterized protein n=1 Tax=Cavenderia fasciculata TaxID=261658 RepID=F4QFR3_CACFS|nr:uncharacterized protein DFA_12080 [Cavenderia fasciculata]EGG14310.1 hypothetical protein DFA_12080 [Cavenderia fasciculata]|eukprot:XP_004351019.1 hypothetical protein DFA_12080 [Cavenderia fasciculata]